LNKFKSLSIKDPGFSYTTLNETLLVIQEQLYSAGDIIFRSDECGDETLSLYVIEEGEVEIYY
jgi:CRP-like cAMP-binding protein